MKQRRNWQWASAVMLAIACLALLPWPARAAVQEIRVTAAGQDASPTKAQAFALDYAKKRAVYLVLLKMHVPNPIVRAQSLTDEQMRQIIRGATILQSRRDGDVTYANVSVSVINEALMRALEIEMPKDAVSLENTAPGRGVLVLPVYLTKERAYVWEKENIHRKPMSSMALKISHGLVAVPTGDYEDLRLIDQHNALTVKASELQPMFERYGVREIIIVSIPQEHAGDGKDITLLLRRLSDTLTRTDEITLPPPAPGESADERLDEIATEIATAATQIATATSKQEQETLSKAPQVPVYFYYGSMREIGRMQEAIRATEGVMQMDVPVIALNNIHGILYLSADKDTVKKALTKKGLIVTDHEDGWQVSIR